MNRTEVIEALEIIRERAKRVEAEAISVRELTGRVIGSLKGTPEAKPAPPPPPRDPEGFYAEPKETFREPPPQQTNGDHVDFLAESLGVGYDEEGRQVLKIRGGGFKKYGVRIWPEVLLAEFGLNADELTPGLHPFKHRVRAELSDGKPRKVIGRA